MRRLLGWFKETRLGKALRYRVRCLIDRPSRDVDPRARQIISRVFPFTMTATVRIATLIESVRYIVRNRIPGDIAECGVWRGGSMMAAALVLLEENDTSRDLYLYDTFQGMTEPEPADRRYDGRPAQQLLARELPRQGIWCHASLEDVRANLLSTGYPESRIHFVQGKVEETIPQVMPDRLALLRLDTDWYQSTRHELQHLYPIVSEHGVVIIDDYGFWQGSKQATDEYFGRASSFPFLHRVDDSCRILIKHEGTVPSSV